MAAAFLLPLTAGAVNTTWEGGASGSFNDGNNWSEGVPAAGDAARFVDSGEVEVTFTGSAEIESLVFLGTRDAGPPPVDPRLTFVLGSNTLTHTGILRLNYTGLGTMTFVQNGGTINVDTTIGMAWSSSPDIPAATSRSVMIIENGGKLNGANQLAVGYTSGATGELHITGGSLVDIGNTVWVGRNGYGVLRIEGTGSEFNHSSTASTHITLGYTGGNGTLEILDGGKLSTSRVMNLGHASNQTVATLLVSGEGSNLQSTGNLNVGGYTTSQTSAATPGGTGYATFADGAVATFNVLRTYAADPSQGRIGTVEFDQSGGVTVAAASFAANSVVRFGLYESGQDADLIVSGDLELDGAFLEIFLSQDFIAKAGDSFSLISYGALIPGMFANPDGQIVIGDWVFAIDYDLGGANVIGLTVVPEPGMVALSAGVAAAAFILFRRRLAGRRS